jgi:hypothetical protein
MSDPDTKTWIDAARTYDRLRRRIWRLSFGSIGTSVGFAVATNVGATVRSKVN